MPVKTTTPGELARLREAGTPLRLIDVRTPAEFREAHVEGARLVPLDRLDPKAVMESGGEPVYVLCRTGGRARKACEAFAAAGFGDKAILVEGGTLACVEAGLPVVRGQATISLERQVRIAAGALVLLGTGLGAFAHPAFLGLPAFVGAGLVFAGITDYCGMALLLGRMPWNHVGGATS